MQKRKLIEVALPLEAINRESAREKSIRHGHPSTMHLWWARRPLAAARAVLFAQLVDDPSSHPDRFSTEEDQRAERERLHGIIERLVVWENIRDEKLLAEAHAEIMASCDGNPPPILDPFAGGGTIPLEAQRLGLEAHASDLNPVAVLINKALIEIPPKFRDQPPTYPGLADSEIRTWKGAEGLAADVRAYGQWMRDEAEKRIGHLYPKATLPDGSQATVIAWIWARTVTCPNPACGIDMPLVRSWWLGKMKGDEAYIVPALAADPSNPGGRRISFEIGRGLEGVTVDLDKGSVSRSGATCVACGTAVSLTYIRSEGRAARLRCQLAAVVAESAGRRTYLPPLATHQAAADMMRPANAPVGELPHNPRDFKTPNYGMTTWADLFTSRQLAALSTFSDLIDEARERVWKDASGEGLTRSFPAATTNAEFGSYADGVATMLAFTVSRLADRSSTICTWDVRAGQGRKSGIRNVFARQAIPMTWDFAEANVFSGIAGSVDSAVGRIADVIDRLPARGLGVAVAADAVDAASGPASLICTDPPYYDNIGYSDLSDFFYVWLRRALRSVHPELLNTMLVPKADELVANPYRHGGRSGAKEFFEAGFQKVFAGARKDARDDFPICVFYAFKQSDSGDDGKVSTGWETLLDGMIESGWAITATWPMRSELSNRMLASGTNALASSIVLALRPRPEDAPTTDRRGLIASLQLELPDALPMPGR